MWTLLPSLPYIYSSHRTRRGLVYPIPPAPSSTGCFLVDGLYEAISRDHGTGAVVPSYCKNKVVLPPAPKLAYTCAYLSGKSSSSLCPRKPLAKQCPPHSSTEKMCREKLNTEILEDTSSGSQYCALSQSALVSRWLSRSHSPAGECSHLLCFKSISCLQVAWLNLAAIPPPSVRGTDLVHFPCLFCRCPPKCPLSHPPPGEGRAREEKNTVCRRLEAKLGKFPEAATFFLTPCHHPSLPASTAKQRGTYPSPTTTHLMACMSLDPWWRTAPGAKESQAKANSGERWANWGISPRAAVSSRLQEGRKWKRELQSHNHPPVPPPLPPQQQLCGQAVS